MNENTLFFEDEPTHVEVGKAGQPGHAHRGPPEVILIGWMVETTSINHKFRFSFFFFYKKHSTEHSRYVLFKKEFKVRTA